MPIKIQSDLPAREILDNENIFVMDEYRAMHQNIRPLQICILNLMPVKQDTPLQVDVTFMKMNSHLSLNTSATHLNKFYDTFDDLKSNKYDGLIITGAPVEQIPFEEVDYWKELCEIMEWSKTHVHSTFHICWGAQAGLYYHFGLDKRLLPEKLFGVFEHRVLNRKEPLVRGFDDVFCIPHSRHTETPAALIHACKELTVMAESNKAGDGRFSLWDIRNMIVTRWMESTSAIATRDCRSMCRKTIIRRTIRRRNRSFPGVHTATDCIQTG